MTNLSTKQSVDEDLKIVKSGDSKTSLSLAKEGNGAKVDGNLIVTDDIEIEGFIKGAFAPGYDLAVADLSVADDLTVGDDLDVAGDLTVAGTTEIDNYLYLKSGTSDFLRFHNIASSPAVQNIQFAQNSVPSVNWYQIPDLGTGVTQYNFDGGTITAADTGNTYDSALYVFQVLNDSSDSGSCVHKLIEGSLANTDITGWDEIYLMHLAGAGTTWINNAGSIAIPATQKVFFDGGTDATNGHTYIQESGADILDIYVGSLNMMKFTESLTDKVEILSSQLEIDAGYKFFFDGGADTYIQESSPDALDFYVGGINMLHLDEASGDIEIKADEVNLMDEDGTAYTGDASTSVQTKAQIDAGQNIQISTVTISEAEMNALHTTEKTLVAAQGSNLVVLPTSVYIFVLRHVSTAQGNAIDLHVSWTGTVGYATNAHYYLRRFMYNEGGNRIYKPSIYNGEVGQNVDEGDNRPLTIKLSGAITTDSITTMKVITTYSVFDNS